MLAFAPPLPRFLLLPANHTTNALEMDMTYCIFENGGHHIFITSTNTNHHESHQTVNKNKGEAATRDVATKLAT